MEGWMHDALQWLSVPEVGLWAVFLVALISATLLPLGSEPAVMAYVTAHPEAFWAAVAVATVGNTLGGGISWWMGRGAEAAYERISHHQPDGRALRWLQRFGPKACLLSWLPIVGDPLCAVAGWLKLPFWPCLMYMAIGKALRYVVMTGGFVAVLRWW